MFFSLGNELIETYNAIGIVHDGISNNINCFVKIPQNSFDQDLDIQETIETVIEEDDDLLKPLNIYNYTFIPEKIITFPGYYHFDGKSTVEVTINRCCSFKVG